MGRTILLKNSGGDEVRSPKEGMPCLLRFDWSKPIDAKGGRGNGLDRSENKRPENKEVLELNKIPRSHRIKRKEKINFE
ncbi:hypothetical protein TNCV_3047691 [Trichonephila clavipes]|nr:hypothetical protein TNCV_3047691 [Trichonephila clavipes]